MQKLSRFIALIAVTLNFLAPATQANDTIFGGSIDKDTGEVIGLCLTNPNAPECAGIDCTQAEFQSDPKCKTEAQAGTAIVKEDLGSTGITGTDRFSDLVIKFINFALPYLTLATFVGFVVAGFFYSTAFGNDEQLEKAKKILIWSTVGIILVIFSFTIVQFLTSNLVEQL